MRYEKGQIAISEERDIPLLILVRDARAIRSTQLYEHLLLAGLEPDRRTARWRVTRLTQNGLIGTIDGVRSPGGTVLAITREGIALLESYGHSLLSLGSFTKTIVRKSDTAHMIELNDIRLALLRSKALVSWQGEMEIISQNLTLFGEGAKDYDAVVKVDIGGATSEFAIEYERTAKSTARYLEIRKSIENDHRVDLVLYLTPSQELIYLLNQQFQGIGKRVAFGISNVFKRNLFDSNVFVQGQGVVQYPFRQLLN